MIVIHVDYNHEHSAMTLADTNGQPILFHRTEETVNLGGHRLVRRGGWVLEYGEPEGPGEYITGITDLTAVDEAVASAQEHLRRMGYREPLR
jgi:hypothetical protein